MAGRVSIQVSGETIHVAPAERLPRPEFDLYLAACREFGGQYDAAKRAQRIDYADPAMVRAALVARGFTVADGEAAAQQPARRGCYAAETPQEKWAQSAIMLLAGCDPDHAMELNDVGFNRMDGTIGHSFAEQLRQRGCLTEKQWGTAIRMCRKYRRQVGECPPGDEEAEKARIAAATKAAVRDIQQRRLA